MKKNTLSLDAETNGLRGRAFCIGAILYGPDGKETQRFIGRCPIRGKTSDWVAKNVIPQIREIKVTHKSYKSLLRDFASFYVENKDTADVVVHMGCPVETKIFDDMYDFGFIGEWDNPYPLLDISGNLEQVGEDPLSVDSYVQKYNLSVGEFQGGTHNPLYDAAAAAEVRFHLKSRISET